ncbi:MAG TPA: cyclic nucleotide-binding domain-containing protein [Gaiellaceae bacterium]|nr:cyclic nucleotide-binding domain-containing protein [Gaiellaceae bacterium]
MRIESSVTAISWIPSDAIEGMPKLPFELGVARYDAPPPDRLEEGDLERLRAEDRFREANRLAAWIEVDGDEIVGHGYEGAGLVGSTTFNLGLTDITIPGVPFEVLRHDPEVREDGVRFVQTVGGRAGFPAPRRVTGRPFVRIHSATAWTTLALTIRSDGSSEHELVGASTFPRHWVYDADGNLVAKSGAIDFKAWYRGAHGERTPWGDEESDAFVTAAESALEREISRELLAGKAIPERRTLEPGETLVEQGAPGDVLYLVLDGVLAVEVDGDEVAEIGPGAIVGEKALLEGGTRTATLRAQSRCRVAVIPADLIDRKELETLSATRGG